MSAPARYLVLAFTAQTRIMAMIEDDEMAEVSVPGYVNCFVSKIAEKLSK